MASDPKKPTFDAPPVAAPKLFRNDLSLDRRQRSASEPFEEVTDPMLPRPSPHASETVTRVVKIPSLPPGLKSRPTPLPMVAPEPTPPLVVAPREPSFPQVEWVPDSEPGVVTAEPAALWRRVGAWLTDLLFISVLGLLCLTLAATIIAPKNLPPMHQLMSIAVPGAALTALIALVYTVLFAVLWSGRTPGRRLLAIHLVDATGQAPGLLRAITRASLSLVSFGLFLSGFWLALFDRHGQTLHDKLTRTYVVKF